MELEVFGKYEAVLLAHSSCDVKGKFIVKLSRERQHHVVHLAEGADS